MPTLARCEPTIKRESRYWARESRGLWQADDLEQEARIVALRVLQRFDPERMTAIETPLTVAVRRHFRALIQRSLARAFLDPARRAKLVMDLRERPSGSTAGAITARLLLARIAALSPASRALATVLMHENGRIVRVAAHYRWTEYETRQRVRALRREILKETRTIGGRQ